MSQYCIARRVINKTNIPRISNINIILKLVKTLMVLLYGHILKFGNLLEQMKTAVKQYKYIVRFYSRFFVL